MSGVGVTLSNVVTVQIGAAEIVLSYGIAAFGCMPHPTESRYWISFYSLTVKEHSRQIRLSV